MTKYRIRSFVDVGNEVAYKLEFRQWWWPWWSGRSPLGVRIRTCYPSLSVARMELGEIRCLVSENKSHGRGIVERGTL